MSPGSFPRKGIFSMKSSATPMATSTMPSMMMIFAIPSSLLFHEELQHLSQRSMHFPPGNDHIHHAVLQEKLRPLKTRGKLLFDRLFDNARSRKTDEALRLGENDVAEHGEARGNSAEGGIGEHGDERQPCLAEHGDRRRGLGHLHKREYPFLHPRAA